MKNFGSKPKKGLRIQLRDAGRHLENSQYAKAIELSNQILRSDPLHLPALEVLAKACWRNQESTAALAALDSLIVLNPYEPGYHYMRGACLQSLGRYGEAVRAYDRCEDDGGIVAARAREAREQLEAWQEELIADILRDDRTFRIYYRRDPIEACKSKGFLFSDRAMSASPLTKQQEIRLYDRPS